MKMRAAILEPGAIVCWKKYNTLKRLWAFLTQKELPNNMFCIVTEKVELLTLKKFWDLTLYEPIRKYSNKEIDKLKTIYNNGVKPTGDWLETVATINAVRANTFCGPTTLTDCRYYKKVELNEKLDEYIY